MKKKKEKLDLSIILPVYKERQNLEILIPEIEEKFKDCLLEIIIIDDDSRDGTEELLLEFNKHYRNINLIKRPALMGIGSALREGYNDAKGEFILSSDADLSFTVFDMARLYKKIKEGYDFVLGYRHGKQAYYENKTPLVKIKYFISKGGNWIVKNLSGINIKDFSANFRIIRQNKWRELKTVENTNTILFEMVLKAAKKKFKLAEIPVSFYERKFGKSKLNLWKEAPKFLLKFIRYTLQND